MSDPADTLTETEAALDAQIKESALLYVRQLQAFFVHATIFGVGMLLIFTVNLATNIAAEIAGQFSAWWSLWAFLGWGLGIATHGIVVRLNRPSPTGPTWEQRQINKVLGR